MQAAVRVHVTSVLAQQGVTPPITVGIIQAFAGKSSAFDGTSTAYTNIPPGWLPCDGRRLGQSSTADTREINNTLNTAALFAALGHSFEQPLTVLEAETGQVDDRTYLPFHQFTNGQEVKVRTVAANGAWSKDPMDPSYFVQRLPQVSDSRAYIPHVLVLHTSAAMTASMMLPQRARIWC